MIFLRSLTFILAAAFFAHAPIPALAGKADVVFAKAERGARNLYRFDVTVKHADTGWDHYADRWDVLDPAGNVLGVRKLFHPHVGEQPFTRSLGGVKVPKGLSYVTIRAHDSKHGLGGKVYQLKLK